MKAAAPITTLLLDIGGVLLTDGWSLPFRALAAQAFDLDPGELETRHHQAFDTYELGKLSLDGYLDRVVFHRPRPFTHAMFRQFMFAQSRPCPGMLDLMHRLKADHGLKIVVVSNEGRELNAYRIRKFKLDRLVDCFVSSCFVHLRKPDPDIFRMALDIAQVPIRQAVYVENTKMFVQIAQGMGLASILHTDLESTARQLAQSFAVETS
jgi:putative hydrolase of the HAD superfamily